MKISEVIKKLQEVQKEHGDIEVKAYDAVKGTLLNYNQIVAAADGLIRELKKGGEK